MPGGAGESQQPPVCTRAFPVMVVVLHPHQAYTTTWLGCDSKDGSKGEWDR